MAQQHGVDAALVGNGVDLLRYNATPEANDEAVAERYGLRAGAPMFLAVGGVEERKNTQRIFQAFLHARAELPNAQLVIAGGASLLDHDAYQQDFSAMVKASGIASGTDRSLELTGTVADDDMPALFRAADVVLLPSLREGFGLVVLEGLATGKPVVVSRIAPFTEYLQGAPVHWAEPNDAASIARAMGEAADASTFAPPAVCHAFSWAASAERHASLYRTHVERRSKPCASSARTFVHSTTETIC